MTFGAWDASSARSHAKRTTSRHHDMRDARRSSAGTGRASYYDRQELGGLREPDEEA